MVCVLMKKKKSPAQLQKEFLERKAKNKKKALNSPMRNPLSFTVDEERMRAAIIRGHKVEGLQ